MSFDCERSARNVQDLKCQFGELTSSSGSTQHPEEILHRGSVPQIVLVAAPTMQSCQRRGRELLNERRKHQHPSLTASHMQRKRSSSLGAEVSLTIDHSYVPVQPEEVDGSPVSPSPKPVQPEADGNSVHTSPRQNKKLPTESCSDAAAADSLEKKADLEGEGSPLADKEGEEEVGTSSGDGPMENEQLLQELAKCRKQIQAFSQEAREWERGRLNLERTVDKLRQKLNEANALTSKGKLKRWLKRQGMVNDLCRQPSQDDVMEDPLEVMRTFIESERLYLNCLTVLDFHYQQPMKTLSGFKPEVLSLQQLESLFLNCSELLILHRYLYEELSLIQSLPESLQLDKFFSVLEKVSPSFSLYNCFTDSTRQQTLQRELRLLQQKPEFAQLLQHCQSNCEGKTLKELLALPSERLCEYSTLLTRFHASSVRGLPEEATKRAGDLIHFLKNLRYDLLDEKSEWDHTLEKIKLLHKLVPDRPIPMEIFNSDVHLLKQGPLTQVVSGKELPRFCFLFSKYIAVAERVTDTQYRVLEHGMIPLYGAQLHKCVDVEGQAIAPDLQSGLKEDLLAFRLSFVDNESLFFRAAKPNQRNTWIQTLEKSIQDSQHSQHMETEAAPLYPDVGPKIAAASMEKLFQQLTSPHKFRDDFMEVFLMTHSCFTSPQEVLTALLNCIKQPEDRPADSISQGSGGAVFSFEIPESEHLSSPCISTSTSLMDITSDSEPGTPTASPSVTRRNIPAYPPPSLHAQQGTDRKVVVRSSLSTSDSDSSPHTSAVVVDNPQGGDTKNGWTADDPEMSLKILPRVTIKEMDSNPGKTEDQNYVTFYRHTHNGSDPDSGDNECSDVEEPDGPTPRPSLANTQIFGECGSELEDGRALKPQFLGMSHSLKLAGELDEASKSMQELMDALSLDFQGTDVRNLLAIDEDDTFDDADDQENLEGAGEIVRRRSRTLSENALMRHSVLSTISLSEPDLTQVGLEPGAPASGVDRESTSLLPRHTASPQPRRTTSPQQRHNSEPQYELTASLSFNESPFHHGTAMTSLPASPMVLNRSTHSQEEKVTPGKSKGKISKSGKKKKADTLPNGPARYGGKSPHSLFTKSTSSMSFSLSGTEYAKNSKGIKSWIGFRRKAGKKLPKSTSMEAEEALDKSPGHSRAKRTLLRKHSISSDSATTSPLGVAEDRMVQGSPLHRHRTESTSQGNSNLVSKIFSVLDYWQEEYFEDFEEDVDLRQVLEDFLRQLVSKSYNEESLEVKLAQQLLDMFELKMDNAVPPNCSFPTLLARVTKCDPHLIYMYDWEDRDKLMVGREIDLSTRISKDSPFLRTLAEQLTLMEFSIYAAIQRRELLNCNWKKPDKEKLAPNVCRLIRRTNEMTSWVCTEILTRDTPAARATVIEHFVQIATHCYNHNDMHCALSITVALASSSIKGLTKTWEEVDKKYRHRFEKMKVCTDYHGRCRKMRERLEQIIAVADKSQRPSALPYIGAYLDQIYTLEMNSKTCNPDGLVNFAKMTKLADLVRTALQYQTSNFKFEPRLDVIAYVTAAQRLSENELYELSIRRESSSR